MFLLLGHAWDSLNARCAIRLLLLLSAAESPPERGSFLEASVERVGDCVGFVDESAVLSVGIVVSIFDEDGIRISPGTGLYVRSCGSQR